MRAVLQDPFLRRIVDIDQADALGIAAVPLKIVGRRPVEKLWRRLGRILCEARADSGAGNRSGRRRGSVRLGTCGHYSSIRTQSHRTAACSGQRERRTSPVCFNRKSFF